MSYVSEPATHGKVLLVTTLGDFDLELWSRECPLACRNFVQLCLEGYYDGCLFHRVMKGFMAQTVSNSSSSCSRDDTHAFHARHGRAGDPVTAASKLIYRSVCL